MRSSSPVLPVAIIFIFSLTALAQGTNTLQGRVVAPDGTQPRTPVRVTLTYNGRRIQETFTDLSGRFSFTGLVHGTYHVTAEGDGQTFETTSAYAEISAFGSGAQLFRQDIQLRAIRGKPAAARAGVVNAFSQEVPKPAREKFEQAQKLAAEGKSDLVMAQLQEAVKLFPAFYEARLMIGNLLIQNGKLEEAIPELDRAREVNPTDDRVYQSFGLLLMKQRKYPVAVAIFEEAARLNPANPVNPLMRGSALIYQASYLNPGNSQRGDLLIQAELALLQASDLSDKKMKPDAVTMSMFYEMKGEPARAARELEEYLQKNPTAKNAEAVKAEISRLQSKANQP